MKKCIESSILLDSSAVTENGFEFPGGHLCLHRPLRPPVVPISRIGPFIHKGALGLPVPYPPPSIQQHHPGNFTSLFSYMSLFSLSPGPLLNSGLHYF